MGLRTVTSKDIFNLQWPSHPTISPDGQFVVYEKSAARAKENDYETHLYLADFEGKTTRILTSAGTTNVNPVWSPDAKSIAFLSNRIHGLQLWIMPLDGGEARCLTNFRHGISSIVWSPDGKTIYGLVPAAANKDIEVFPKDISTDEVQDEIQLEQKKWQEGPKRYNRQYYKNDGIGYQTLRYRQIVAVNVSNSSFKQLTRGATDSLEPVISPDGKYIAFTSSKENENVLFGGQIYRVPTSGGEVELIYNKTKASTPSYSPDGKWLAFLGTHEYQQQLFVMPANGGEDRRLSKLYPNPLTELIITDMRLKTSPQRPQWSNDSNYILALGTREGRTEIIRFSTVDITAAEVIIGGDRTIFHFSYDGVKNVSIAYSSPLHPGKVAAVTIDGTQSVECIIRDPKESFVQLRIPLFPDNEVRLDDCNDQLLSEVIVSEPEVFTYRSEDNWQIQGFLLKPANFDPQKKYPVVLAIHGGPHYCYGFTYTHELQLYAAQGYAVVFTNPRGSAGFGEEFSHAVRGDYGGKDHLDILNGLDEALNRYEFLDGNRVAVNGLSYGGFMTNWLVTHTDRFFSAVSEGSICNWISMYGTSDIGPVFITDEFLGKTDPETLWKHSPLAYVQNVKTPLLLIHSEMDLRCPIEQAEQFYTYIKSNGGEVELLRIPNSSHLLLQSGIPGLRLARLNAMVDFINGHLPKEVSIELQ